jgi:hypothetical protein
MTQISELIDELISDVDSLATLEHMAGSAPTREQVEQAQAEVAASRQKLSRYVASLEYALLEIIGTADEYKAMPCDSLERRFFSTVERYRSVVEKA